jgi:hypothetical protein
MLGMYGHNTVSSFGQGKRCENSLVSVQLSLGRGMQLVYELLISEEDSGCVVLIDLPLKNGLVCTMIPPI